MKYATAISVVTESCDHYTFLMFTKKKPTFKQIENYVIKEHDIDVRWEESEKEPEHSDVGSISDHVTEEIPK